MKEQLYNDFVANVLPKIEQGMTISYDYFLDLFGRYVTYLFITDVVSSIIFSLMCTIIVMMLLSQRYRTWLSEANDDFNPMGGISLVISILVALILTGCAVESGFNAIKAKFIPEVRVYEEIQSMRSINNN